MPQRVLLEICLESAGAAKVAQQAGADRVELCSDLAGGGLTPSYGTILQARKLISIPLQVMIRPRAGDFCYSDQEFEVMKTDILAAKELRADGVVLGILHPDGKVDIARTQQLVKLARPLSVTFHRAFDLTPDPLQALEDVIFAGADKLLTSGQEASAPQGTELIKQLIQAAQGRIIILPGAGLNTQNLAEFLASTGAEEVHMSASKIIESTVQYNSANIRLGSGQTLAQNQLIQIDANKIRRVKEVLQ